jgi:hypothetical protein
VLTAIADTQSTSAGSFGGERSKDIGRLALQCEGGIKIRRRGLLVVCAVQAFRPLRVSILRPGSGKLYFVIILNVYIAAEVQCKRHLGYLVLWPDA